MSLEYESLYIKHTPKKKKIITRLNNYELRNLIQERNFCNIMEEV